MDNDFNEEEFENSLKEIDESFARLKESEEHYAKEITKYFDRIHDKLFNLNNVFIAGYVALIAFTPNSPKLLILLPLLNCCFLIYVDWRMMEASRLQSKILSISEEKRNKAFKMIDSTNILSLAVIITTFIVTIVLFAFFYWR